MIKKSLLNLGDDYKSKIQDPSGINQTGARPILPTRIQTINYVNNTENTAAPANPTEMEDVLQDEITGVHEEAQVHPEIPGVNEQDEESVVAHEADTEAPAEPVENKQNTDDNNNLEHNLETDMNNRYGARSDAYNLRPRKQWDYSHLHAHIDQPGPSSAVFDHLVLTQHRLTRGLKEFGIAGVDAVIKELQQLYDREVIEPINPNNVTDEHKRKALQYLMFLKKKRCG